MAKRFDNEQILLILADLDCGRTLRSIAEEYGVSVPTIHHIKTGKTYNFLTDGQIAHRKNLSEEDAKEILEGYERGEEVEDLAILHNTSERAIREIISGRTFKNLGGSKRYAKVKKTKAPSPQVQAAVDFLMTGDQGLSSLAIADKLVVS